MVFKVIVDVGGVVEELVEIGPGVESVSPGGRRVSIDLSGCVPVLEWTTAFSTRPSLGLIFVHIQSLTTSLNHRGFLS